MKILKSIQWDPDCSPTNFTMKSPSGKPVASDQGKAKLVRQHFAKVLKRPCSKRKGYGRRAEAKCIQEYIRREDIDGTALPYSFGELTVVISYLKCRKACGEDGIYNEFLLQTDDILKHCILHLVNLIWETGVFPRSFLNSIMVPVFKGEIGHQGNRSATYQWPWHLACANSLRDLLSIDSSTTLSQKVCFIMFSLLICCQKHSW